MQYRRSIGDLERLRSLSATKWTRHGPDVLPAWVADMDLEPASAIKRSITEMVDRGDLGYQTALGDSLVPAWLRWIEGRHGLTLPEAEVWPFSGVMHGLETAMMLHTRAGDGVVVFTPVYFPFMSAIRDSGRRVVDVPLADRWRLDVDCFAAAVDATTRVVLFSQPHNPIGRVFSAREIRDFADVVVDHDLLVISDEIWADLPHAPHRHLPLVQADERLRDHTVTLGSATKAFNTSGLRCALGHVGHPELREQVQALPYHLPAGPSTLSVAAAIAAWTEGVEWLDMTSRTLTARRDHLAQRLADEVPEVGFDPPEATYLAWLDLRRTALGDDPAAALLEKAGVALSPGRDFGDQGGGCARLNFATTESILDEIIDRIVRAVVMAAAVTFHPLSSPGRLRPSSQWGLLAIGGRGEGLGAGMESDLPGRRTLRNIGNRHSVTHDMSLLPGSDPTGLDAYDDRPFETMMAHWAEGMAHNR